MVHTCSNEYPESRSWPGAYGQVLQVIALPAVYGGMAYSSNLVHGMRKSVKAEALDQRVCTWFTLSHKQSAYHIPLHLPPVRRMPFIAPLQGMTRLYQFHVGATRENCIEWRWVEGIEAETRTGLRWNTSTCVSLALSSRVFQVQSYVDTPSILQLPPSQQESIAISRSECCNAAWFAKSPNCRGTKWIHHLQAYQASRTSRFQFDVIIQNDTTCADHTFVCQCLKMRTGDWINADASRTSRFGCLLWISLELRNVEVVWRQSSQTRVVQEWNLLLCWRHVWVLDSWLRSAMYHNVSWGLTDRHVCVWPYGIIGGRLASLKHAACKSKIKYETRCAQNSESDVLI